jgi:hypothetical protein
MLEPHEFDTEMKMGNQQFNRHFSSQWSDNSVANRWPEFHVAAFATLAASSLSFVIYLSQL